ncbi:DEAD/DEAH box helicase [Novosphingobium sp. YJ-S2-02]|uniref:DEAD/DEAH box helicase n=1 Tax=Novosphingobium aureum TaxID=2792964 RepID=A0A931HBZ9_9SPHN|nr:DEAD/DEAH box helicase [Novosphingobium aureum]MBH0113210.1 DEAD/DEAH box helicase [Novosphingobium aureum]
MLHFHASTATLCPLPEINGPLDPFLFDSGLHDWQFALLDEVARLFHQGHRRVLLQCPTGGGKTVMALSALLSSILRGWQAMFLVHRKELIRQTSERFTSSALGHSFVASKFPFDPEATLLLAGVQTLVNRLAAVLPPRLVIVDECHHAVSKTYTQILEYWPDAFILGLTATPERLDGRGLGEQYDVLVKGPSPQWLIANHYLAPYDYFAPDIPDMSGVGSSGAEINREAAAGVLNRPKLVGSIVEHYLRLGGGGQGIVFAQNRKHSRAIAAAFSAEGIPASHVDGDTPDDERDAFDKAFRCGDIRIGVNVNLFGEGYDVPNISYLGIGAATKSLINHLQWCGRVLRYVPGKRAVICDHAGNAIPVHLGGRGLGLPDDDRDWSLDGAAARRDAKEKDWTSITQCLNCYQIYPSAKPECPGCSSHHRAPPPPIKETAGKLSKLEREAAKKAMQDRRKREEWACKSYREFLSLAQSRNYQWPVQWAKRQCHLRKIAINPQREHENA